MTENNNQNNVQMNAQPNPAVKTASVAGSVIGNIVWILIGGWLTSLWYVIAGILMCITIIGIPFGIQVIKLAGLALLPFGKEVVYNSQKAGCLSMFMNVLWFLVGGWEIALVHMFCGLLLCITIIGIPIGLQHFKMMTLAFAPFGKTYR